MDMRRDDLNGGLSPAFAGKDRSRDASSWGRDALASEAWSVEDSLAACLAHRIGLRLRILIGRRDKGIPPDHTQRAHPLIVAAHAFVRAFTTSS